MGPIGTQEMIVIFLMLVVLALPVAIVLGLVWYFSNRRKSGNSQQPLQNHIANEQRLTELEQLRAQNLISEEEWVAKRTEIIRDI